jgi:hypothetical protein
MTPIRKTVIFTANSAFILIETLQIEMTIVINLLILYGKEVELVNGECTVFN